MLRIAVLISGGGSNLQAVMDAAAEGRLQCSIEMVISDRAGAFGIERAKSRGIKTCVVDRKQYGSGISDEIYALVKGKVDLIVLAGFLSILQGKVLKEFKNRIINIHPSLVPAFCGSGMFGIKVHEKAIEYGVKYSGCTVHFVDEGTDTGAIIAQSVVPVYPEDTAKMLQERVLLEEHKLLPQVIEFISEGKVRVEGRSVFIEGRDESVC